MRTVSPDLPFPLTCFSFTHFTGVSSPRPGTPSPPRNYILISGSPPMAPLGACARMSVHRPRSVHRSRHARSPSPEAERTLVLSGHTGPPAWNVGHHQSCVIWAAVPTLVRASVPGGLLRLGLSLSRAGVGRGTPSHELRATQMLSVCACP